MSEELNTVKSTIRALLISSPRRLTVNDVYFEYRKFENEALPFQKFNFRSTYDFLRSMPDTVRLLNREDRNTLVEAVTNEETRHVQKLVSQQRPSKSAGSRFRPAPHRRYTQSSQRRFQVPKPVLHVDFKKDVFRILQSYPNGMPWNEFDCRIQKLLMNYCLQYDTLEVFQNITEFAVRQGGKIFLNQNLNHHEPRKHSQDHSSDGSIIMVSSDSENIDEDEGIPSVSRPQSRGALSENCDELDDSYLVSENLIRNFRDLLDDGENMNGIWLTKLTQKYKLKFGYALSPKEHGFTDVLDMVANLPSVFFMKQYRAEGDHILLDARKFKDGAQSHVDEEGSIPRPVIDELNKLLKSKRQILTNDLLLEYRRMYQKQLRPEQFGFTNLDSFLLHLENLCHEFSFRRIGDHTVIKLNYAPTDVVDSREPLCDALPGDVTYDPFPQEVCNGDFKLGKDPFYQDLKKGDVFLINLGEIYTPGRFYITPLTKVALLENMMADLHEFYDCNEQVYRTLTPLVSRNLLCACLFSRNSQWHRVRVLSVSLKTAKILYIDYGTHEEVPTEKLRYLHKDFAKYPPLCIQAKLSGIQPKDGGPYSTDVCHEFLRLFGNCDLEVEVVDITSTGLEIFLYAVVGEDRVPVHEELIRKNLVERKITKPSVRKVTEDVSRVNVSPPKNRTSEGSESTSESVVHDESKTLLDNHPTPTVRNAAESENGKPLPRGSKAFFDRMAANNILKEELKSKSEGSHFSWLPKDEDTNVNASYQEVPKALPKAPPGIPQPARSYPSSSGSYSNQRFQDSSFPYPMYDPLYQNQATTFYTGTPFMTTTLPRPAYPYSFPNVFLPNLYPSLSHLSYQNPSPAFHKLPTPPFPNTSSHFQIPVVTCVQNSFRPPPGISTPPTWTPPDSTSYQKMASSRPKSAAGDAATEKLTREPLLVMTNGIESSKSPIGRSPRETEANDSGRSYRSSPGSGGTHHSEGEHDCSCKICPTPKEENSEKEDTTKEFVEKYLQKELQKVLSSSNTISVQTLEQQLEDIKALRERQAAENKLKEYFSKNVNGNDEEEVPAYSCATEVKKSPELSATSVYASEFIPKSKPKSNRNGPIDAEISSPTASSTPCKKTVPNKLNTIKAFVLQQSQKCTPSTD